MKHNFSTDELKRAHEIAAKQIRIEELYTTNYLSAFLDALPDPQDDWQSDDVKAVRKGDRVRWTVPGCEDNESYEIEVVAVTNHTTDGGVVVHSKIGSYFFPYGTVVDRIPAPHPDPKEHPVVIDGNGTSWFWSGTGDEYHSPERPGEYKDRFTNWTPGEVVPKVVADND